MFNKGRPAQAAAGKSIIDGVIWKQLLIFFFPILLGTFFQQLYNTADAIIVGKYVGKEALAAVGGATGNLINLIVGFFVGLSSGATVIISQFFGGRSIPPPPWRWLAAWCCRCWGLCSPPRCCAGWAPPRMSWGTRLPTFASILQA